MPASLNWAAPSAQRHARAAGEGGTIGRERAALGVQGRGPRPPRCCAALARVRGHGDRRQRPAWALIWPWVFVSAPPREVELHCAASQRAAAVGHRAADVMARLLLAWMVPLLFVTPPTPAVMVVLRLPAIRPDVLSDGRARADGRVTAGDDAALRVDEGARGGNLHVVAARDLRAAVVDRAGGVDGDAVAGRDPCAVRCHGAAGRCAEVALGVDLCLARLQRAGGQRDVAAAGRRWRR